MKLQKGSSGEHVKQLQSRLGLEPDGVFGLVTESKVKSWQSSHGLVPDGIVGEISWKKLFPTPTLNIEKLRSHIPDIVLSQIPNVMKYGITTNLRLAHFLAQCAHESAGFKAVTENLNYSSTGLKKIFPKYFPGNLNVSYARNPQKIANRVYASRMGNGNEASGDGWKYRGRGYIQLTGKGNYIEFDKTVEDDILNNPDLVATKYPLASAAFFFYTNSIWVTCDRGFDNETVAAVTRRVNGGAIGLPDRIKHFKEYYALLK